MILTYPYGKFYNTALRYTVIIAHSPLLRQDNFNVIIWPHRKLFSKRTSDYAAERTGKSYISGVGGQAYRRARWGRSALLYIYLQRTGSDLEGAARELCRTMGEIEAAHEKLLRMGLIGTASVPSPAAPAELPRAERQREIKLPPAEELPEYRAEDIVRRSKEDDAFAAIVAEAQKVLGHVLSSSDLKRLFGIYDYLALPPEVVLELLNYCVSISCSPSGEGRRPSMRFIEKEAYAWVHMEDMSRLSRQEGIYSRKASCAAAI